MPYKRITQPKEWFEKKYLNDHLSCREIASLIGDVSHTAVHKKLRQFSIPIRSPKDAIFYDNGNQCKLSQGYFWIYQPDHPRANYKYVKRAVLVLEKKLGRHLRIGEFPHHIDGSRMNDDPANLEITNRSIHMSQHFPIKDKWHSQKEYLTQRKKQALALSEKGWNKHQIINHMKMGAGTVRRYLSQEPLMWEK